MNAFSVASLARTLRTYLTTDLQLFSLQPLSARKRAMDRHLTCHAPSAQKLLRLHTLAEGSGCCTRCCLAAPALEPGLAQRRGFSAEGWRTGQASPPEGGPPTGCWQDCRACRATSYTRGGLDKRLTFPSTPRANRVSTPPALNTHLASDRNTTRSSVEYSVAIGADLRLPSL